ncbi:hypothetical protein Tco_1552101, partial [Tanacetum coccineum]
DGWKAGCRKIIALDGCFLKSLNQGEILTAIGRDGNNHIYPVAWAVGLIEPVKDVMPNAEHMQCARHIYKNFRKQYPNKIMDKIKSANPTHKYLMDKNPKTWSRAFFEVDRGCEEIENGFSECFNSVIVNVRHKLLLTMLKAIRVIVLEWMNKMREISRKWNPGVCPNIKKRFEWVKEQQRISGSYEGLYLVFMPQSMYSIVLPPKLRKMPGRPRKKIIRAIGEGGSSTRVSKVGSQGSCSNCKKPRHNKSSCKESVVEQTPKPKGVVDRPRKKQLVDDFEDVDVVQRGSVGDEGASGTRGCVIGSKGRGDRGGAAGSRDGASGSIGKGVG